ncbi:MAG: hypothetical protein KUF74_09435 [Candidatus Thiodiazotropha sp. (ex Ctena orbiculata)]|nr:hypothetical protein [Candidatus Thiodiazotropha taylori]
MQPDEFDPVMPHGVVMAATQLHTDSRAYLKLDPEQLESHIGFLISRFQGARSKSMAQAIVLHMEVLCSHPDYFEPETTHCGYQRTLKTWRMIAGESTAAV